MREIRSPLDGIWSPFAARAAQVAALSGARTLVRYEAEALALDFTDNYFYSTTSLYGSAYVKDTGTPANDYDSTPCGLLTYTSPSAKMTLGPSGTLRFGAHNLLTRSDAFNESAWTKGGCTASADATLAPDGTTTADDLVENSATSFHEFYRTVSGLVNGATYALSARIKPGGRTTAALYVTDGGVDYRCDFTLTGAGSAGTATGLTASITADSNGFYLCSITRVVSGGTSINVGIVSGGYASIAGLNAVGISVWGAHLRRTPSDSTYLATTSAARYALPYEWDANGDPLGLLVEEQRTNLCLYSADLNTGWASEGGALTRSTSAGAGPDGDIAIVLTETGATQPNNWQRQITGLSSGATYAFSVTAKAGTNSYLALNAWSVTSENFYTAVFDLTDASTSATQTDTGTSSGTISSTLKEDLGNGWYRLTVVGSIAATSIYFNFAHTPARTGNTFTSYGQLVFTGTNKTTYIKYPQLELGSFRTSIIPTLGSTVTRAADNITLATSAFPWDAATDSVYAKFRPLNVAAERRAIQLDDGTANERFTVGSDASANGFAQIVDGGATQLGPLTTGTVTTAAFEQMALAFAANDVALSSDGGAAATDTSATVPTVTTLRFGSGVSAASPLNGILAKALIIPRRVSNADLQTLTGTGVLPAP